MVKCSLMKSLPSRVSSEAVEVRAQGAVARTWGSEGLIGDLTWLSSEETECGILMKFTGNLFNPGRQKRLRYCVSVSPSDLSGRDLTVECLESASLPQIVEATRSLILAF